MTAVITAFGPLQLAAIVLLFAGAYYTSGLGRRWFAGAFYSAGGVIAAIAILGSIPPPGQRYSLLGLAEFALTHYLAMCLFWAVAYVAGRQVMARMVYASKWEQFSFSTTLGFGILSLAVLAIGLVGWLYPPVLLVVGLATLLLGRRTIHELLTALNRLRWGVSYPRLLIAALVSFAVVPILLLPLYPPTQFDATNYHLVYAKQYAASHRILYLPYLRTPVFPQMFEMLSTAMLVLFDDIGAQLAHFSAFLLIVSLAYSWGLRAFSPRVGLWAAALCLASPLLLSEAASADVDVGLALFTTASLYAIHNWATGSRAPWLYLSAVLAGFGAGTKYSGLVTLAILTSIVVYKSVRMRDFRTPILFGLTAGLAMSPFYIRNFHYTGNPFWPFLGPIFGYGPWSPEDYQANVSSIREHGAGVDALALVQLPWNLVFNTAKFGLPIITPLHILLIQTLLVGLTNSRTHLLFLLLAAYVLFWFYSAQDSRYLLPILPLLNLLLAGSLERFVSLLMPRWRRLARPAAHALICAAAVFAGMSYARSEISERRYPPATAAAREKYLADHLPPYPAVRWLNDHAKEYRVYQLYGENMNYFFDGEVRGDWFGQARYDQVTRALNSGEMLYDQLKSMNMTHFLVTRNRQQVTLPDDEVFRQRFRQLYRDPAATIYQLVD